jgi:cell wall-associated NlpC family hydrolase
MHRIGLLVALCAVSAACASTGAVPRPFPSPGGATPAPRAPTAGAPAGLPAPPAELPPAQALGHRIAAMALEFRGVPYRNGGADPGGFDCSGLVAYVFTRHGRSVPRHTSAQFAVGSPIDRTAIRAGDLVFFSTVAAGASHVGIALDDDEFVHAPSSRGVVRVERLTAAYWRSRFIGARRLD